jgi:hypothetical protein
LNPENDKDCAGHTDGQTKDVYKGDAFVFDYVSKSDFKIIDDHDGPSYPFIYKDVSFIGKVALGIL